MMNRISRFGGPALRGVADQALTSAENFAIGVILVRNCPKAEFGLYALGYGILVLGWSLIAALITAQLPAVFSRGSLNSEERRAECSLLLRKLLVACTITASCGCLLTLLLTQLRILAFHDACFWLLLSSALPAICLRDFMRRYFFQEKSETRALLMDASALALTVATLGILAGFHTPHLNNVAVAVLALGGLAVATGGIAAEDLWPRKRRDEAPGLGSLFRAGRWNVGATMVSWVQSQVYTLFVTAMLGLSGLAAANAPRVLLTPITLLSTGLALPLLPRFAKQKTDLHALVSVRSAGVLLAATFGFVGLYALALWLARGTLIPLILGGQYGDVWPCIVAWAIANAFINVRVYYTTFLLAKGSFRRLAAANVFSAVIVIGLTAPLIHFFGVTGGVYSIAAGELILGASIWHQGRIVAARFQAS